MVSEKWEREDSLLGMNKERKITEYNVLAYFITFTGLYRAQCTRQIKGMDNIFA